MRQLLVVTWICLAALAGAFQKLGRPVRQRVCVVPRAKNANSDAKGFGKKVATVTNVEVTTAPAVQASMAVEGGASSTSLTPEAAARDKDKDVDAIFAKYGIKDEAAGRVKAMSEAKKRAESGDAPFGESIIAKLDGKTQALFDNILVTCVSISLSFVVLCGIGISAGSLHVVFPDINIPEALDSAIVNFLTPAFTPGLGIFFFFSITFGLFKFAQISSSQTVYRES